MSKPGFTNAKYCLVALRPAALASYEGVGFPAVLCDEAFTVGRRPRPCVSILVWLPDTEVLGSLSATRAPALRQNFWEASL